MAHEYQSHFAAEANKEFMRLSRKKAVIEAELARISETGKAGAFYVYNILDTPDTETKLAVKPKLPLAHIEEADSWFSEITKLGYKICRMELKSGDFTFEKQVYPILERKCSNSDLAQNVQKITEDRQAEQIAMEVEHSKLTQLAKTIGEKSAFCLSEYFSNQDHKLIIWLSPKSHLPAVIPEEDPMLKALTNEGFTRDKIDRENDILHYVRRS